MHALSATDCNPLLNACLLHWQMSAITHTPSKRNILAQLLEQQGQERGVRTGSARRSRFNAGGARLATPPSGAPDFPAQALVIIAAVVHAYAVALLYLAVQLHSRDGHHVAVHYRTIHDCWD